MNIFLNLARWYFSRRTLPYWMILILDCMIVFMAGCIALALTEGTVNAIYHWKDLSVAMIACLCCYLVGFRLLHTYSGVIRYSSFVDLQRVAFANLIGLLLTIVVRLAFVACDLHPVLNNMGLLTVFIIATMLMWMLRVVVKFIYDMGYNSKRAKRVFIYGTRQGGVSLA